MTREEAWKKAKGYLYDALSGEEADEIIKALEQEPCEDAISRQVVLDLINADWKYDGLEEPVGSLPPVTLKLKTGYWIEHPHEAGPCWEYSRYECSECHEWAEDDSDFCPYCGAKMVEPQEGEE